MTNTEQGTAAHEAAALALETPTVAVPEQHNHVKHGDIMPYARKNCGNCFGSGEFTKITPVPGRVGTRTAKICHCALRRFLKLRGREVRTVGKGDQNALVWKLPALPAPEPWKAPAPVVTEPKKEA